MSLLSGITPFGADAVPDGIPRVGEALAGGKYRVDALLGVGGMGAVLGATHVELGQRVAVKLLLPGTTREADAVPRFLSEARAAARIDSEHVVRIYDVDRMANGTPYIVMEHLDGQSLGDFAAHGWPLPIPEALDCFLQACLGVAEAHVRGIVHRDLKPSNLFVTRRRDGSPLVKVLDFGIVKAMHPDDRFTRAETTTALIMGTPQYMSPEQIRSSRSVDRRSDVWSMGVVLFEILAGTRPFDGASVSEVCAQVAADPPIPLRVCRPDIPAELEAVVLRCLTKDRERRFQSVAELATALLPFAPREASRLIVRRILDLAGGAVERAQTPKPPASRAPSAADDLASARTKLDRRWHPGRAAATAAIVAIAAAALGALTFRTSGATKAPGRDRPPAVAAPARAEEPVHFAASVAAPDASLEPGSREATVRPIGPTRRRRTNIRDRGIRLER